jgi:hypothetical protein
MIDMRLLQVIHLHASKGRKESRYQTRARNNSKAIKSKTPPPLKSNRKAAIKKVYTGQERKNRHASPSSSSSSSSSSS